MRKDDRVRVMDQAEEYMLTRRYLNRRVYEDLYAHHRYGRGPRGYIEVCRVTAQPRGGVRQ